MAAAMQESVSISRSRLLGDKAPMRAALTFRSTRPLVVNRAQVLNTHCGKEQQDESAIVV